MYVDFPGVKFLRTRYPSVFSLKDWEIHYRDLLNLCKIYWIVFSFFLDVIDGENHVRHIQTPIELLTCVYFCSDRRSRLSYIDNKPMFIPQLITSFFFSYFHSLVFFSLFLLVVYMSDTRLEACFPCYNHFIHIIIILVSFH